MDQVWGRAAVVVTATTVLVSPAAAAPVPVDEAALTDRVSGQVIEIHVRDADLIKTAVLSAEFVEWRRLHAAAQALAQLTARKQLLDSSLNGVDLRQLEQEHGPAPQA